MMRSSILIIDDKPEDLAQLSMPLIRKGIHVRVANNGMTGSQLAAIHKPDLILLDVHMPNINGFSVAKLLLNHDKTKHIPIMFITSANDDASRIEGLSIGAMDYIIKPFNTQEVLLRIDIQLRLHHKESVPKEIESIELLSGCTLFKQPSDWEDALLKNIIQHYKTRISQPSTIKEVANIYGINEKKTKLYFSRNF